MLAQFEWTAELAYVVGLITTDGSLSNDKRHIIMVSKDRDQLENFSRILLLTNQICRKKSSFTGLENCYKIQFGNVKFYRFLQNVGLCANKTKIIGKLNIPDNFFIDFLRGHLDGDGYTYSYWDRRWKNSFRLYTGFISASYNHVLWLEQTIERLYGLRGRITHQGKSIFRLIYAKRNSIALLKRIYYSDNLVCLKRKKVKISRSLGIIEQDQ